MSFKIGKQYIQRAFDENKRNMRDKKVKAIVDQILWSVAKEEGPEVANALIKIFDLNRPAYGSHEYFDDDTFRGVRALQLEPNFKVPDSWKIMPWEENFPGEIRGLPKGKKKGK